MSREIAGGCGADCKHDDEAQGIEQLGLALETNWDEEGRENLLRAALERVRQTVNPAHYEMYHLHVVQGLPPRETARALGVSTAAVYLAKHRVGKLLQREIKKLEARARECALADGSRSMAGVHESFLLRH